MGRITCEECFKSLEDLKAETITIDRTLFVDMYKKLYEIENYTEKMPLTYALRADTDIHELVEFIETILPYRKVMQLKSLLQYGRPQDVAYKEEY